ncbi:MAG: hypothetical protein WC117_00280 [Sphaerochaetaceae bacterium]
MSNDKYKPVPRVRMTLSLAVQNKVIHQLSTAFGISETWDRPHVITCFPSDFAHFMALVAKMDNPPTMKQLGVEYVDVRKDVLRTTVSQRGYYTMGKFFEDAVEQGEPEVKPEPVKQGIDYTADAENWGTALNNAAWVFNEACPEKSALLFNNLKAPLRAAILKYLGEVERLTGKNE